MVYKGDAAKVGYGIETTFDEAPSQGSQSTWLGIIPNIDFDDAPEYKDYHTINSGSGRDLFTENKGKTNVTGTIPIELQNGRIIYLAMGTESIGDANPIYTHTITGAATQPSMCIEATYDGTNDFMRYYRGVKIDSLDIEVVDGGEVKASASLMAARSEKSANSSSTIDSVNTKPFMFHQGAVTIDGYGDFDVTSFKWSIKNSLKARHTIRSTDGTYAKVIVEGKRDYELATNVIIPDTAVYNSKIYDDLISGKLFTTSLALVRTAAEDQATLSATNCTIRSAPHNIPEVGEEVEISITMKPRTSTWTVIDEIPAYS